MREYELTVLLSGELDEKAVAKEVKSLSELLTKANAKVKSKKDPQKKTLAYEIAKVHEAYYLFYELELDPAGVADLDGKVKLMPSVIRYLLVKKGI